MRFLKASVSVSRGWDFTAIQIFYKHSIGPWKCYSPNSKVKLWFYNCKRGNACFQCTLCHKWPGKDLKTRFKTWSCTHHLTGSTAQRMCQSTSQIFRTALWNCYMLLPSSLFFNLQCSELPKLPLHVKIVEVGPRDGLQNEKVEISQF